MKLTFLEDFLKKLKIFNIKFEVEKYDILGFGNF